MPDDRRDHDDGNQASWTILRGVSAFLELFVAE